MIVRAYIIRRTLAAAVLATTLAGCVGGSRPNPTSGMSRTEIEQRLGTPIEQYQLASGTYHRYRATWTPNAKPPALHTRGCYGYCTAAELLLYPAILIEHAIEANAQAQPQPIEFLVVYDKRGVATYILSSSDQVQDEPSAAALEQICLSASLLDNWQSKRAMASIYDPAASPEWKEAGIANADVLTAYKWYRAAGWSLFELGSLRNAMSAAEIEQALQHPEDWRPDLSDCLSS